MSQSVYAGISGSGKSYEVVRGVIVPGVANGRRVVTNVAGLQIQAIYDYCVDKLGADRDKLGEIVQLENEDIERPNLFPLEKTKAAFSRWFEEVKIEKRRGLGVCIPDDMVDLMWDEQFIVQGGDVVVLDECRRWYETGQKPPNGHVHFFRMHRHFLHWESGIACDVVFITQDFKDLQRKVVGNNDRAYVMEKHDDLGFSDRYVINIYKGTAQNSKTLIESIQDKYNPEIFKLYKSHSQKKEGIEVPREIKADGRGNLLNRKMFRLVIPAMLLFSMLAVWRLWVFFHPAPPPKKPEAAQLDTKPKEPERKRDNVSSDWRLVGYYQTGKLWTFVLVDQANRMRYLVNPPGYKFSGPEVELLLPTGEAVTRWTGQISKGEGSPIK